MKTRLLSILILCAVVLTACSTGAQAKPPEKELQTAPQSSKSGIGVRDLIANINDPSFDEPVIIFQRSGGFVGVNEEWKIYADGRVTFKDAKKDATEQTVKAEQVSTLLKDIETAGFFTMDVSGSKFSQCDDCFEYVITVTANGQTKTINATADTNMPAELQDVIQKINDLIGSLNATQ